MPLWLKALLPISAALAIAAASCYLVETSADSPMISASVPESAMHVNSGEAYEGVPKSLSPSGPEQPASTACPVCSNEDPTLRHKHQCQQHNIKHDDTYRGIKVEENRWIRMACEEAYLSVKDGGGPFGAVVVQIDNESDHVIRYWRCRNLVTKNMDPTAHAEVTAVRMVAKELGVFNLGEIHRDDPQLKLQQPGDVSRCEIYSSCEPCPMCYAAIRWARINTITFSATRFDAAEPGVEFSDLELYRELATRYEDRHDNGLRIFQATTPNSLDAFNLWKNTDKVAY